MLSRHCEVLCAAPGSRSYRAAVLCRGMARPPSARGKEAACRFFAPCFSQPILLGKPIKITPRALSLSAGSEIPGQGLCQKAPSFGCFPRKRRFCTLPQISLSLDAFSLDFSALSDYNETSRPAFWRQTFQGGAFHGICDQQRLHRLRRLRGRVPRRRDFHGETSTLSTRSVHRVRCMRRRLSHGRSR